MTVGDTVTVVADDTGWRFDATVLEVEVELVMVRTQFQEIWVRRGQIQVEVVGAVA